MKVTASYRGTSAEGDNFTNRSDAVDLNSMLFGAVTIDLEILKFAPRLHAFMADLQRETQAGKKRSAFSCAEAAALGRLLGKLTLELSRPGFAWEEIRFTRADDGGATVGPCNNCLAWLEEIPGPHPQAMRLRVSLLREIGMLATEAPALPQQGDFPSLRSSSHVSVPRSAMK